MFLFQVASNHFIVHHVAAGVNTAPTPIYSSLAGLLIGRQLEPELTDKLQR